MVSNIPEVIQKLFWTNPKWAYFEDRSLPEYSEQFLSGSKHFVMAHFAHLRYFSILLYSVNHSWNQPCLSMICKQTAEFGKCAYPAFSCNSLAITHAITNNFGAPATEKTILWLVPTHNIEEKLD